ncbi:GFA family protein [Acinetobacter stercoris]|uniref:Putative glutathione-dependent formaldehyde-activating enzyme n=1 Tax=Acinetobacter stercoris TaxID=2126983 RepID=A0A2U3N1S2_9GAMM|nr:MULTISPECIES: GFA family protein [Acinetobacter]SPL71636.1 putative glutathione-dependent formaldehyde-activating enzyme [Acinetobacter stercoris]
MEEKKYTGSCLCGGIRYEIHGEIGDILECHCQRCRKANGTAFATNAPVKKTDFKITHGENLLKKFESTPTTMRCFCSECGSPIISIKEETPDTYRLRIGTLDSKLEHKPSSHIFVAYKAEWDTIYDDLPQYAERP